MAIDFKIQNKCDHLINWEKASISIADYKRINVTYPIAARNSVLVRINNVEKNKNEYIVVSDLGALSSAPTLYIQMNKKVRDYQPLIEVSYTTYSQYCPKCYGAKTLDDIKYGVDGDFFTVRKELKLIQTLEKYIITRLDSNPFHSWIGTELHSIVGSKIQDFDLIRSEVIEQVSLAIEKLKDIQSQLVASGRKVDKGELFGQLISLTAEQDETDPTIIRVLVEFTARSGQTLQFEQLLEFSQLRERLAF